MYASNWPVVEMYSTFAENFNVLHETFGDDEDFFINNAIKFAVDRVASRMKVIAGVSGTVYDDVLRMTKEATAAKADAVMAVSPYYFGPTDDATLRYFLALQKKLICLLFYITFLQEQALISLLSSLLG
jgi:hypothetical protein